MSKSNESVSVAEIITALTAFSFVLSVCYEKGYFYIVGTDLFRLLSTTDIISSAIYWLPWPITFAVASFLWETTLQRIEGWRSEEELIKTSSNPKFIRKFRRSSEIMAWYFIPLCFVLNFLLVDKSNYKTLVFPLVVISIGYTNWILNHPRCPYKNNKIRFYILFVIILLPISFILGMDSARDSIRSGKKPLVLVDGVQYKLLRRLQEGVLIRDNNTSAFKFIKSENIENITYDSHANFPPS